MGVISTTAQRKRRRDRLKKKVFLVKLRKDPVLMPVPFLEPGQSPHPVSLVEPVLATIEATLLKQVHEIKEQIRGFGQWQDCLAQEAERPEKQQVKISNWVRDLLDQRFRTWKKSSTSSKKRKKDWKSLV